MIRFRQVVSHMQWQCRTRPLAYGITRTLSARSQKISGAAHAHSTASGARMSTIKGLIWGTGALVTVGSLYIYKGECVQAYERFRDIYIKKYTDALPLIDTDNQSEAPFLSQEKDIPGTDPSAAKEPLSFVKFMHALQPYLVYEWPSLAVVGQSRGCDAFAACFRTCLVHFDIHLVGDYWHLSAYGYWKLGRVNVQDSKEHTLTPCTTVALIQYANITWTSRCCDAIVMKIRLDLYASLLHATPLAFFDEHATGGLLHTLTLDAQDFRHSLKQLISNGIKHSFLLMGNAFYLFYLSPKAALILCITALPSAISIGHYYGKKLRASSKAYKEKESIASGRINEVLGNVRLVLAFVAEEYEIKKYYHALKCLLDASTCSAHHFGLFQSGIQLALQSLTLAILLLGASMNTALAMEHRSAHVATYLLLSQQAQTSLAMMSGLYAQCIKALSSGSRIFQWMQATPQPSTLKPHLDSDFDLNGDIQFNSVNFAYPSRKSSPVFDHFNLTIKSGQVTAFCGRSGSGKSTLAALLERFYEPDKGSISIHNTLVSQMDKRWLRSHIGYIPQEPTLFNDSILENIRYGNTEASFPSIIEAAKQAHVHDFIQSLPNGYHTMVGEKGLALSGGQKQRLAIARAILKDPKILILDEATSALDNHSERIVQKALDNLLKDRTVLLIAHKLSTICHADNIVLLDRGRVVEQGTHEELLNLNGEYAKLYHMVETHPKLIL